MRNIFSTVTALVAVLTTVSITLFSSPSRAVQVEPEDLIASCAKSMTAKTKITYIDEAGTVSKRSIGEIALRQFNQYHVLVEKKAPYMSSDLLKITVSEQSPFIHDFQAPRDYYASATVMGVDWTEAKGRYVEAIMSMSVEDKTTGDVYQFTLQAGQVPVVRKTVPPKSPVDVSYVAADGAKCSPWFSAEMNAGFYDVSKK